MSIWLSDPRRSPRECLRRATGGWRSPPGPRSAVTTSVQHRRWPSSLAGCGRGSLRNRTASQRQVHLHPVLISSSASAIQFSPDSHGGVDTKILYLNYLEFHARRPSIWPSGRWSQNSIDRLPLATASGQPGTPKCIIFNRLYFTIISFLYIRIQGEA